MSEKEYFAGSMESTGFKTYEYWWCKGKETFYVKYYDYSTGSMVNLL